MAMASNNTPPPAHATQKSADLEMSHAPVVGRRAGHSNVPLIVVIVRPGSRQGEMPLVGTGSLAINRPSRKSGTRRILDVLRRNGHPSYQMPATFRDRAIS
jgi:hypothetical protein